MWSLDIISMPCFSQHGDSLLDVGTINDFILVLFVLPPSSDIRMCATSVQVTTHEGLP